MNRNVYVKIAAVAAAAVLSVSAICSSDHSFTASYEDEISSLETRRSQLTEERQKLEAELNEYLDGAKAQDEYLKLYDEKMKVQEEEMYNLTKQISILNLKMEQLDKEIDVKQQEVDKGIADFRERLRAMYIAGNDTIAEVLAGSSSFYDMLARLEMVQRISQHDNEMISELCGKVQELDADKTALEEQRVLLDERKTEQTAALDKLRETYANHEETKKWYEDQAAAQAQITEEMIEQENAAEEELQEFIRKQQAEVAVKMAEKKKKQEAERKAKEEELKKAEESRAAEAALTATEPETSAVTEAPVDNYDLPTEVTTVPEPEYFSETTSVVTYDDNYDVWTPSEGSYDEFGVNYVGETAAPESTMRDDDPYATYEFGKVYYDGEEDTYDDSSSDKGYGTSSNTGFIWPVPSVRNVTDGYGGRYFEEAGYNEFHKGIDINKPGCAGEPIVASAGGVVLTASNTGNGYGVHVVIDHGDGISTLYGHMESAAVSVGDEVQQGQVIGYIGKSGQATGYHCHFEVRIDGQHTDPNDYVSMDN